MFACFYISIYLVHAWVHVMWFFPCDAYYHSDDEANLYSSDDHSNQDVLKLLSTGHHVQFTEVSSLTLHTGEPQITPKQQDQNALTPYAYNPSLVHPIFYLLQYMTCACLWFILARCQAIFNLTGSMQTKAAVDFSTGHCSAHTDSAHYIHRIYRMNQTRFVILITVNIVSICVYWCVICLCTCVCLPGHCPRYLTSIWDCFKQDASLIWHGLL